MIEWVGNSPKRNAPVGRIIDRRLSALREPCHKILESEQSALVANARAFHTTITNPSILPCPARPTPVSQYQLTSPPQATASTDEGDDDTKEALRPPSLLSGSKKSLFWSAPAYDTRDIQCEALHDATVIDRSDEGQQAAESTHNFSAIVADVEDARLVAEPRQIARDLLADVRLHSHTQAKHACHQHQPPPPSPTPCECMVSTTRHRKGKNGEC